MDLTGKMITFKSYKKLGSIFLCSVLLSACSQEDPPLGSEQVNISESATEQSKDESNSVPDAPQLAGEKMEDFTVDQKVAKRLHDAKGSVADDWYLERIDNAKIKMDPSISFVVRDRICESIKDKSNIHSVTSNVLSPYHLTGKQQGVIIASSMLSQCPKEKLSVPSGSLDKIEH